MAHHKRKKSRRNVRCVLCTDSRNGNSESGPSRHSAGRRKRERAKTKDELNQSKDFENG